MRNARRNWHPAGPAAGIGALLLLAVIHPGCGDDDGNPTSSNSSTSTGGGNGGTGGTGGTGGSGGVGGGTANLELEECHNDGAAFITPFDATPDLEGNTVYFTALNLNGDAAVFRGLCGQATTQLVAGDPLVSPFNIALSTDGSTLFIADAGADTTADDPNDLRGQIFTLPSDGGVLTPLAGTEGTVPQGLEVRVENGNDQLYFTGLNPTNGLRGLYKLDTGSGAVDPVAEGAPFVDPGGVALTAAGDAFVLDTDASGTRVGAVVRVSGGVATAFVTGLNVGFPAGIAISTDEQRLLVSGHHPVTETDVVYFIDIATQAVTTFATGIDAFSESAGLHRAKNADVYAWADSKAQGSGTVFVFK